MLRPIHYLIAVADHGSFTRAALALHVSQPALSQQIRHIEAQLGVALFDRSTRQVRLTDAGRAYIGHARRALQELDRGARVVQDVASLASGTLRIGFTPTFMAYLVGPVMQRFHDRYTGIGLKICQLPQIDIEAALLADELDLGVGFSAVNSADVAWEPLHKEHLDVVVGPRHQWASRAEPVAVEELNGLRFALLGSDFATRRGLDAYFDREGCRPEVVIETNSVDTIIEMVRQTAIASIMPRRVAVEQHLLHGLPLIRPIPPRRVALLSRRLGYVSAARGAFEGLLRGYAQNVDPIDVSRSASPDNMLHMIRMPDEQVVELAQKQAVPE